MSFQCNSFQDDAFQLYELVVVEWVRETALAPGVWPEAAAIANPWSLDTPALASWLEQSAPSGIWTESAAESGSGWVTNQEQEQEC